MAEWETLPLGFCLELRLPSLVYSCQFHMLFVTVTSLYFITGNKLGRAGEFAVCCYHCHVKSWLVQSVGNSYFLFFLF